MPREQIRLIRFHSGNSAVRLSVALPPESLPEFPEEPKKRGELLGEARPSSSLRLIAYSSPACTFDGVSGRGGCSSGTSVTASTIRR